MGDFHAILAKVQQSIAAADDALARGNDLSVRLRDRIQEIDEARAREQQKIDREIVDLVDDMDEETVRFIGELEQLEVAA